MKKVNLIAKLLFIVYVLTTILSSCAVQTLVNIDIKESDEQIIQSILAESKNSVNTLVQDPEFYMNGVSEFEVDATDPNAVANETSSSHVVNEKFELDIDSVTTGNKYDPNEVNVYGQFVSPSGVL